METQQFCLKWNSHQANMLTVFEQLLSTEALVDVTLACDGLSLKAHKVVLSACSPYFQSLFVDNPCKHPIVIMKDMRYSDLKAIIDFMYKGEVNVSHDQLNALLKTAETLKVKGLAEMSGENRAASSGTVQQNASSPPPTNMPVAQTRSDSPAMLSKRKHGRPRKRYRSGSVHSDEEIVPTKIKEPESPEIEELPQDPSDSISESIPVSSKHQTPIHSSAAVNNSHLSRKSQSSRSSHQTEEPPSDSDFSIEPSKLMEQTLTTTPVISNGLAQSSSSGISVNTSSSLSIVPTSLSIVPAESQLSIATDSHSSNQTQGPDSPQDVKPLLSFEEPLISVDPSQDNSSFMDSSGVPAIAGTSSSYQEDQQALVPQDTQSQGKKCDSCGANLNPPWISDRGGHYLCTSCKLFVNGENNGSSFYRNRMANSAVMACSNCGTTTTSVWRRNSQGETVCNACGLYFKLHNINRPTSMRKFGIQRRWSRKSKNQAFTSCDDIQILSSVSVKSGKPSVGHSFQTC